MVSKVEGIKRVSAYSWVSRGVYMKDVYLRGFNVSIEYAGSGKKDV
jgi:hypothetical protein